MTAHDGFGLIAYFFVFFLADRSGGRWRDRPWILAFNGRRLTPFPIVAALIKHAARPLFCIPPPSKSFPPPAHSSASFPPPLPFPLRCFLNILSNHLAFLQLSIDTDIINHVRPKGPHRRRSFLRSRSGQCEPGRQPSCATQSQE